MLIRSMAGDFKIEIHRFEVEGGQLVMVGAMGVWEARTYISPRETLGVIGKLLSVTVIGYLLRLPYLLLTKRENE